jgi:Subtilase family
MKASRRWLPMLAAALLPLALASPAAASTRTPDPGAPLTPADVARLSANATERSIIVLRNQHPELPARGAGAAARVATVRSDQQAVTSELDQLHGSPRSLHTVNAVAATISQAEANRLAANPAVQAVVPDRFIPRPAPQADVAAQAPAPAAAGAAAQLQQVCPADPAVPLLEPEALQLTNTEFQRGAGVPAAHDLVDGSGVTVAFIADGLDINNPDLTRNGHSIVVDYQDFSGDGVNAVTGGGEAFGDAASIAAQGNQTYDLSTFVSPAHPLPPGCTIQIKGMAPGANLVALKVFGTAGAFDSTIIQAIDWAVEKDHVNVINESFGANPFPDDLNDPIQLANANAIAAGITVVASSGDAGFTNTIGNTAASSPVIGVGATTQLRLYRQTTSFGSQLSAGGWVNDNPSSFSSAGFTQLGPRTLDLVAPGDLGWALCSTNVAVYVDCRDNAGRPSNIQVFGGTSESSPLVAGEAALVIQAYRKAHGGASPTPDLVKRIITSTADDLGITAQEQGAGIADALGAVQAALSIHDANGAPAAQGSSLVLSRGSFESTAPAGSQRTFQVAVTNTGAAAQTVTPSVRRLSPAPFASDTGTATLTPATATTFVDGGGTLREFTLHQFTVPAGAQRLDGDITWAQQAEPGAVVRETLFDPVGRLAIYSIPQGTGGFGHVDVHDPMAGTWTAVLWSIKNGPNAYSGTVQFAFSSSRFESFGRVSPSGRVLGPGQTGLFTVTATTPGVAGDLAASLVLSASGGSHVSLPITLRALVPVGAGGGTFTGALEGGNGRSANNAQMFSFQFDVRGGRPALNLALTLRDPNYRVTGFLVSPSGEPLDDQSTVQLNSAGQIAGFGRVMQFTLRRPQAGRWTAILRLSNGIDGAHLQEPFTGAISFGAAQVTALGVPDSASTVLPAGQPVTADIVVTNTGVDTKDFFVDPRLDQTQLVPLLASSATNVPLPLRAVIPSFVVPPDTGRIVVAAQGSVPIDMSIQAGFGGPRREGATLPGNFSVATDAAPQVAPGVWVALPEEIGPFPTTGAPAATANVAVLAETRPFDGAVASSSGDIWQQTVNAAAPYTPLTLAPGASGLITVTFTPSAASGSVVRGSLEVSTFNPVTTSGDQVISVPYAYRVG